MLEALRQSSGVTSRVLLRDEPDAPSPVVGPRQGGPRRRWTGAIPGPRRDRPRRDGHRPQGRDPDLGRDVAMKVLHPGHAGDPALVRRFVEEAQIGGQLQHPGILPVYELGLDADVRPYFTMRLVKGRTLAALLEERPDSAHDLRPIPLGLRAGVPDRGLRPCAGRDPPGPQAVERHGRCLR